MLNFKGGVGKTTSAVFMAEALARHGPTLLVDDDPQGSASRWSDLAAETVGLAAAVVGLASPQLSKRLPGLIGGYEHVVIDGPPGSEAIGRQIMRSSDLVVVPTQAAGLDLDRLWSTLELTQTEDVPAAVLITMARTGTKTLTAARDVLNTEYVAVLTTVIPYREAIKAAYGTRPSDLHGYENAVTEILEVNLALTR